MSISSYLFFKLVHRRSSASTYASIIILSYNNFEFTSQCIESIFQTTPQELFEIILVENGSNSKVKKKIFDLNKKYPMQIIDIKHNIGFVRGNNKGLKQAKGNYIVLLNNDTIVTPYWLERLMYHADKKDVGLAGPITNSVGNEAKVTLRYKISDIRSLNSAAFWYTITHWDKITTMNSLSSFCWIMRRSVFEKIGLLDTRYIKGYFDDDDYCMRVKKNGYKIICVDDVYIHHFGGKTLNQNSPFYRNVFLTNKKRFEKKWGKWIPHKYRLTE